MIAEYDFTQYFHGDIILNYNIILNYDIIL